MPTIWSHLNEFVAAARGLHLRVWLFGSALTRDRPRDLDVLVLYAERALVEALRAEHCWTEMGPPLDIIAVTSR